MEKKEFIIGDKVKIPKTKSKGIETSLENCHAIKSAKQLNQDYLYISNIKEDRYTLGVRLGNIGSVFGIEDLKHYEEEFVLPEKWTVKLKENYDIINRWGKEYFTPITGWGNLGIEEYMYCCFNENRCSSSNIIKEGYTEISFKQFCKHVLKQQTMEKEIIGYKLIKPELRKVVAELLKKEIDFNRSAFDDLILINDSNKHSLKLIKEAGVLDLWFEPCYEEDEYKVGDWVTILSRPNCWASTFSNQYPLNEKVKYPFTGQIKQLGKGRYSIDAAQIGDYGFDFGNLLKEDNVRKATEEEIQQAEKIIVKMYSSNKGEFEIEVVDGKAYYRPENKELPKEWIKEIINLFNTPLLSRSFGYPYSTAIGTLNVGCYKETKKEDWEKVYKLLK